MITTFMVIFLAIISMVCILYVATVEYRYHKRREKCREDRGIQVCKNDE